MDVLKYADINPDDAKHMAQRLHRKKDDLNFVRKVFTVDKVEAIDDERSIVARVSTNDRDRDGEIVEPKGIDLSNYTKNPCLLWAHKYDVPAIGKALWSKTDDKGLICKFQFAPTQFADEIYQLYKGGYQRAFSIGFIPMDFDSVEKVHRKVSLLEVSAVPVPANQDALVLEAYQKGMIKSDQLMQDLNVVMTPVSGSVPAVDTIVTEKDTGPPVTDSAVQPKIDFCDSCGTPLGVEEHKKGAEIGNLYVKIGADISEFEMQIDTLQARLEGLLKVAEEVDARQLPAPSDLSAALASLRQDVAAILARLQVTPEPVPAPAPAPAPAPVEDIVICEAGPDIEIESSPEIVIEPSVPEKSAEELIEEYVRSGDFKRAVNESIEVALTKLRGRVI